MMRTTKVLTISLSPKLYRQVKELAKEEDRTQSELLREALRQYMWARRWGALQNYGRRKAKEIGITQEDVETLIDEVRK